MRRAVLPFLLVLLPCAAAPAAAQDAPPPLRAALGACGDGRATFEGSMPVRPGALRMAMRFDLHARLEDVPDWERVRGVARWGRWDRSHRRVPGLVVSKSLEGLEPGRVYRAVVRFRWYGANGRVLKRATRTSRACRQPENRPNLALGGFAATRLPDGRARYALTVENLGPGAIRTSFEVQLLTAGGLRPSVVVSQMEPRSWVRVNVEGPACAAGERLMVLLDPTRAVRESDEADNLAHPACPL